MTEYRMIKAELSGRSTCTFVPDAMEPCSSPAVAHVLLTAVPPAAAAAFCLAHWPIAIRDLHLVDFHYFGDHCNLPGSSWHPSSEEERGTCVLPTEITSAIERFANQPQGAPA